jgi:hypothetical protein
MTKADPLAGVERARSLLKAEHPPVAELESRALDLKRLIAAGERDLEELDAQRQSALVSEASAGEVAKTRAAIRGRAGEVADLIEIAAAVHAKLEERIATEREADAAAKQLSAYEAVLDRRHAFVRRAEEVLSRVGPELRDLIAEYNSVEQAISAANRSLPFGADRIPSTEAARIGALPAPRVTERRFQGFVHQGQLVGEMGRCEAFPHQGHWVIYKRSNAVQGDETIGPCVVVDFVEVLTAPYLSSPLEALSTSLKIPEFAAPPPKLGRGERRTMPLSDWLRMSGEPEQVPLQVAAE